MTYSTEPDVLTEPPSNVATHFFGRLRELCCANSIWSYSPKTTRWHWLALCCIVLAGLGLRTEPTRIPDLQHTMWKEIDYIQISRNYAAHGMHFLEPEITWPAQPPRVTAMEFPLVPYAAAALYRMLGFNIGTVRLIPLVAFLAMPVYLFFLVRRELGTSLALFSALVATLLPIHHQFGRILFSEPLSILMSVAALVHFRSWADTEKFGQAFAAGLAFTLAVALKFEPLFLLLPMTYLWWRARGVNRSAGAFVLFVSAALVLPIAWMLYAYHLTQTSIDVFGVVPFLKGHNKMQTFTLTTHVHFWLALGHRIWDLTWGLAGLPFIAIGLLLAIAEERARFFLVYGAALASYFVIVAEGQLDAPYRQLNATPVLSVLMAFGFLGLAALTLSAFGVSSSKAGALLPAIAALAALVVFMPSYVALLRENPSETVHPRSWTLAEQIRNHSLPGERMIVLGEYTVHVGGNDVSPVLYYYSGHQGWTVQESELSRARIGQLMQQHATLLAVDDEYAFSDGIQNPQTKSLIEQLAHEFPVLYRSGNALLLRLAPAGTSIEAPQW